MLCVVLTKGVPRIGSLIDSHPFIDTHDCNVDIRPQSQVCCRREVPLLDFQLSPRRRDRHRLSDEAAALRGGRRPRVCPAGDRDSEEAVRMFQRHPPAVTACTASAAGLCQVRAAPLAMQQHAPSSDGPPCGGCQGAAERTDALASVCDRAITGGAGRGRGTHEPGGARIG